MVYEAKALYSPDEFRSPVQDNWSGGTVLAWSEVH